MPKWPRSGHLVPFLAFLVQDPSQIGIENDRYGKSAKNEHFSGHFGTFSHFRHFAYLWRDKADKWLEN